MEKFKFALFLIITLGVVGILGYWAVVTIQSGPEYVAEQKIKELKEQNEAFKAEVKELKDKLSQYVSNVTEDEEKTTPEEQKEEPKPEVAVSKYQELISELQKMIDASVLLKAKSSGPRVGTVQKFLNIYNKTSNKVDNDYGPGTVSAVAAFQKNAGLTADGEAGAGTFAKMIEWLKKQ